MNRLRIKEEFGKYRSVVIPAGASPVQVQECRRAFYAGAWALLQLCLGSLDPANTAATEADLTMMSEIDSELRQFADDTAKGKVNV